MQFLMTAKSDRSQTPPTLAREFLAVHAKIMGPSYAMEAEIREMSPYAGIGIKAAGGQP